jgi:hypothetical protein
VKKKHSAKTHLQMEQVKKSRSILLCKVQSYGIISRVGAVGTTLLRTTGATVGTCCTFNAKATSGRFPEPN